MPRRWCAEPTVERSGATLGWAACGDADAAAQGGVARSGDHETSRPSECVGDDPPLVSAVGQSEPTSWSFSSAHDRIASQSLVWAQLDAVDTLSRVAVGPRTFWWSSTNERPGGGR